MFDEVDELRAEIVVEADALVAKAQYWSDRDATTEMSLNDLRAVRYMLKNAMDAMEGRVR